MLRTSLDATVDSFMEFIAVITYPVTANHSRCLQRSLTRAHRQPRLYLAKPRVQFHHN